MKLASFSEGAWVEGTGKAQPVLHAVTGAPVCEVTSDGLDFRRMLEHARTVGGPRLRALTFHERAAMLKQLAAYLMSRKDEFYEISKATGATKADSWIDIEGGIGTFFAYASRGRRDFPNQTVHLDGDVERLSKEGTFMGRHVCVPLEGAAVHINAFNFPCWGMLEKLAPTFLAGMPAIVKPASITAYLAAAMVRAIMESGILPAGALQMICGSVGDLFEHLTCQDVVTFTGSASTGRKLKSHSKIIESSIRFNLEADSLNCSILGPDALPGTDEFNLFIKEVAREMTVKAGQKCTAIRRTIVPAALVQEVVSALGKRLEAIKVGNPDVQGVGMGPLVGRDQVKEVRERVADIARAGEIVWGDPEHFEVTGGDAGAGAFFAPVLLHCPEPFKHTQPHDIEAFGPVNTVMPYARLDEAIELARRGKGSLVGSLFTADPHVAREVAHGVGSWHGRLLILDRTCAKESTGHGSPLPHLIHGGPGRAGGGEEMGGARGVLHYMQRCAVQGSPRMLTSVGGAWVKGGEQHQSKVHPFRKNFDELQIGDTLVTHRRTLTEADVVNFAGISGDFFYAHMDDIAARESLFEKRVVHGYFVLAAAAGLFVDPAPGPVLANYGIDKLRFVKPVYIGDTIRVRLTCKHKAPKEAEPPQGVVAWDVEVTNQDGEAVALYTILTLVRRASTEVGSDGAGPQVH